MLDPKAFRVSMFATLGAFTVAYLLYRHGVGLRGRDAALWATGVAVSFVLSFGISRRRLGQPSSGSPGFKESLFLGLTIASLVLGVGWFLAR